MKRLYIVLLLVLRASFGQSSPPIEVYGPVAALQVYNSLGTNIGSSNQWEYQAAQAAHVTWGRFDCSWQNVEGQKLPENVSLGYTLPKSCALGLEFGKQYGVHSIVDALYGAPYGQVATVITIGDAPIGATVIPIAPTSGSLSYVRPGQTYVKYKASNISAKHSYAGTLIVGISARSVTIASALITAIPQGSPLSLNLQLYPPVLIPPGTNFASNPSIRAYGNYVHFLQMQIAATGFAGRVSLWNEPPWAGDPWDDAANLYDIAPAENRLKPMFGVELAYYSAMMPSVPNALLDNGYTNKSGNGALLAPDRRNMFLSQGAAFDTFASESFHPYGNNPEDGAWIPSCVKLRNTVQTYGSVFRDCTPVGMVAGSNIKWEAAFNAESPGFRGIPIGITETGLCRCHNPSITEEQVSRFNLRQFLVYAGAEVHPIVFYRLAGDSSFEWLHADHSPYPVYTAFQNLMNDIRAISGPSRTKTPTSKLPTIISYNGGYPLAVVVLEGSRSGDIIDSFAVYTWQRSYTSGKWTSLPSPAKAKVGMQVPPGLAVVAVKDTVTLTSVPFEVKGQTVFYPVEDNPIELMLVPAHEL